MYLFFISCFVILGLTGCGTVGRNISKSTSTFWENFSIGTIVADNTQYLATESRQLSGSESGPPKPFVQKQEEMAIQIEAANLPAFLAILQPGIEAAIIESGTTIVGRSSGGVTGTSFSISYRENDIYGVVSIWGAQGEGTSYYLFAMVTEGR